MKKTIIIVFVMLYLALNIDSKKVSRSRSSGSGRGSSRKTNYKQPAPTSFSYPQPSAPKPALSGWQEKPKPQSYSPKQSNPNTGHSYPSSNTGLSGNSQPKQTVGQENIQRSNAPNQQNSPRSNTQINQMNHNYPSSNGLSGNYASGGNYPQGSGISGGNAAHPAYQGNNAGNVNHLRGGGSASSGTGYPQGSGLSGSNAAPPPYPGNNAGNVNRQGYPQSGANFPQNAGNNYNSYSQGPPPPYSNTGNNYHHPQGPPPPYTNYGHSYGGNGSPGEYGPQASGYFGNYMNNNKGYGGVSRTGNALTGVGIAGAGIGTVLTGLALWNLARSTGHHHHTVIYDNRGHPVGVAPSNDTSPAVDPILGDLVNCTLTISNDNATEVIAIPCSIATSFTPEADVKDPSINNNTQDNTKCIITVVTKAAREFATTIPCSVLLNTAAQNNVTEPPLQDFEDIVTVPPIDQLHADQPPGKNMTKLNGNLNVPEPSLNCTREEGEVSDPINPCFTVKHNLTVIPIDSTEKPQNA